MTFITDGAERLVGVSYVRMEDNNETGRVGGYTSSQLDLRV